MITREHHQTNVSADEANQILEELTLAGLSSGKIEKSKTIIKLLQNSTTVAIDKHTGKIQSKTGGPPSDSNLFELLINIQHPTKKNFSSRSYPNKRAENCPAYSCQHKRQISEPKACKRFEHHMAFHVQLQIVKLLGRKLIKLLLQISGIEQNPGPPRKLTCGNCRRLLGKSTRKKPLFYCTICGWVHNQCSGIEKAEEYDRENFTCTKCKNERVISAITNIRDIQTMQQNYINTNTPSAYGTINRLVKSTGLKRKTVETYLTTSSTYTKFKQTCHRFPRLNVQSYRLNEIWSIDLADMQSLSTENRNTRYLLVAVDTLSRFLRVQPLKDKYASTTRRAFALMKTKIKPEKVWTDDGKEFLGSFKNF